MSIIRDFCNDIIITPVYCVSCNKVVTTVYDDYDLFLNLALSYRFSSSLHEICYRLAACCIEAEKHGHKRGYVVTKEDKILCYACHYDNKGEEHRK